MAHSPENHEPKQGLVEDKNIIQTALQHENMILPIQIHESSPRRQKVIFLVE